MPFSNEHTLPTASMRQKAMTEKIRNKKHYLDITKWYQVDDLVTAVFADLVNGKTKSDCTEKLMKGLYPDQKGKEMKYETSQNYIRMAKARIEYDFKAKAEEYRADLYSKMMMLYEDAVQAGDRNAAINVLDKIMKLTGCAAKEGPSTAIQINGSDQGGITVNFGFQDNNDKEEE